MIKTSLHHFSISSIYLFYFVNFIFSSSCSAVSPEPWRRLSLSSSSTTSPLGIPLLDIGFNYFIDYCPIVSGVKIDLISWAGKWACLA